MPENNPQTGRQESQVTDREFTSTRVFDHVSGPLFRATVIFTDLGDDKTRIEWSMLFNTPAEFDKVKGFAVEGNQQNLDKLKAHLKTV